MVYINMLRLLCDGDNADAAKLRSSFTLWDLETWAEQKEKVAAANNGFSKSL